MDKMIISNGEIMYPKEMQDEPVASQQIEVSQPTLTPEATSAPVAPEPTNPPQAPQNQVSAEDKAKTMGYMTREEYIRRKGSDVGYKSPEEFNQALETAPWMKKERLEKLEMELIEAKKELSGVSGLIAKQFEAGRKAALDELNKKQFDAIQQGDQTAWSQLEREKAELNQVQAPTQQPAQPQQQEVPPELIQWQKQNPWFGQKGDFEMTQEALQVYDGLYRDHPYASPAQLASQVERHIKQKFATKFGLPTGQQNGFVGRSQGAVQQETKTYTTADLTPEDKVLAGKWRKYGYKSQDEYVKDILKTY